VRGADGVSGGRREGAAVKRENESDENESRHHRASAADLWIGSGRRSLSMC
jgi:hypothetical protein